MKTRVVLVVKAVDARQAYLEALKPFDVHVTVVSSFYRLKRVLAHRAYHGIMVDVVTKIKAAREEGRLDQEVIEQYPLIQLRWNRELDHISTFAMGRSAPGGTLQTFIEKTCRTFRPRPIRSFERIDVHYNVLLKNAAADENGYIRSVTIDVSKGGCFLYTVGNWETGQKVRLGFKELKDQRLMEGEVRRVQAWGRAMQIPGIGIRFTRISPAQRAELPG